MIEPRKRDTTAESSDWVYLGEFFQGIGMRDRIRLAVYRSRTDHTLHRLTSDELTSAGPRLIAVLTEPPDDREEWHPAWESDEMRPDVEARARALAYGLVSSAAKETTPRVRTRITDLTMDALQAGGDNEVPFYGVVLRFPARVRVEVRASGDGALLEGGERRRWREGFGCRGVW